MSFGMYLYDDCSVEVIMIFPSLISGMTMPGSCLGKAVHEVKTAVWLKSANHHANKAESADPVTASMTLMRMPVKKK